MSLYEYLALSKDDQWDELWEKGNYLKEYEAIDSAFQLYAIGNFFVEIEFCIINGSSQGLSVFKEGAKLDKYLDEIQIPYP